MQHNSTNYKYPRWIGILGGIIAVILISTPLYLSAQTKPKLSQIAPPQITDASLLAIIGNKFAVVRLSPGVEIVSDSGGYFLRVPSRSTTELLLTRDSSGAWPLTTSCISIAVYRNGLRQLVTKDYTISNNAIRFTDGSNVDPSEASDLVLVECTK